MLSVEGNTSVTSSFQMMLLNGAVLFPFPSPYAWLFFFLESLCFLTLSLVL